MSAKISNSKEFLTKIKKANTEILSELSNIDDLNEILSVIDEYDFYELAEELVQANISFIRISECEFGSEEDYYFLDGMETFKPIYNNDEFWTFAEVIHNIYDKKDDFILEINY